MQMLEKRCTELAIQCESEETMRCKLELEMKLNTQDKERLTLVRSEQLKPLDLKRAERRKPEPQAGKPRTEGWI